MNQLYQLAFMRKTGNWISANLLKFELIFGSIIAVSVLVKTFTSLQASVPIGVSVSILAIVYFLTSLSDSVQNNGKIAQIVGTISSYSPSVVMIGILYKVEHLTGYQTIVSVGIYATIFAIIVRLITTKERNKFFKSIEFKRLLVLLVIGILMHVTSTVQLLE